MNSPPSLILCSTVRIARSLRILHAREQASRRQQWQPLPAFTLNAWLDEWVEQALLCGDIAAEETPQGMLSSAQERLLWEQAIESSLKNLNTEPLFDKAGLAAAAQEANRLLIEWNLSLNTDDVSEETRQFLVWRQRFQSLCRKGGWLEGVRYFSWQLQCLESGVGEIPEDIRLAGFDRFSPLQQRFVEALRARGASVTEHVLGFARPQSAGRAEFSDREAECRAAVEWARRHLERRPDSRLAIVVPELAALRDTLVALLDEVFHADCVTPLLAQSPRFYDFSLGTPLSDQPVVAAALDLLRFALQRQAVSQAEISELLLNPFWSSGFVEADDRALLDAEMRAHLPLNVTSQRFQQFVVRKAQDRPSLRIAALVQDLQALLRVGQTQGGMQSPSAWAACFRVMLQAARWPGERSLSSHEYQAQQAFEKVLDSMRELDPILGAVKPGEAVRRLVELCRERIFQPEAADWPQLQVLGMLEAAAGPLDAMWVMGMNDHVWPPAPAPNPLLPAHLQRAAGTPNADSRVQMEFAMAVHRRLLCSAREIVFSSAKKDGERLLRISPVLQDVALAEDDFPLAATLAETLAVHAPSRLHMLDDARAPLVREGEHVSGGTGLLKAQAICPAWAFYQYRLHARSLKEPVSGLDAMERGTLVHAVLECFWAGRRLSEVQAMTPEALSDAVADAVGQALSTFSETRGDELSAAFVALERERLHRLTLAWLQEIELQRSLDFAVTAREQEQFVNIEGISIRLVMDRIDMLDDGSLVLLDYKTGRQNDFRNWAADRITEPQLPVYAAFVLAEQDVAAVCFARVRIGEYGFVGISRDEDVVPGAVAIASDRGRKLFPQDAFPDWQSVLMHWRHSIERIARELRSGEAAVRFEDESQLIYCEVLPLLRLPERRLQYERSELAERMLGQQEGGGQ